jgi:hypothetical protein
MFVRRSSLHSVAIVIATCAVLIAQAASAPGAGVQGQQEAAAVPAVTPANGSSAELPVLEHFRVYRGKRTPAALCDLFTSSTKAYRARQRPEILLSSGAATVSISFVLPSPSGSAPNFAFNGARLLSYTQIKADEWLIEALPETGVLKAEMLVLTDSETLEVPLVVAPPLPAGTDLSEKGFTAFLGGADPAAVPQTDLNGDGRRDYLDDYIFTANYLARKNANTSEAVDETPPVHGEPVNGQDAQSAEPAAGTGPESQRPAPLQSAGSPVPAAGPATGNGSAPTAGTISRDQYNSMTYEQKKRLRAEQARKKMQQIKTQEQ